MTYAVFVEEIKNNSAHTIIAYFMNEELEVLDYKNEKYVEDYYVNIDGIKTNRISFLKSIYYYKRMGISTASKILYNKVSIYKYENTKIHIYLRNVVDFLAKIILFSRK